MYAKAISDYLEANGIKRVYVSQQTGIKPAALTATLNGSRKMTIEEYVSICRALGLDLNYFMGQVHSE